MPRKAAKTVDDTSMEELDALIQEVKPQDEANSVAPGTGSVVLNFLMAATVSAMPIYLYISPMFNLSIDEHSLYFGIVTLVAAVFVTLAYNKTTEKEIRRLSNLPQNRKSRAPRSKKGKSGEESDSGSSSITVRAVAWAMFYNNLLYLVLFMVLAFNVVPSVVPAYINYIVAVAGPGVIVNMLA